MSKSEKQETSLKKKILIDVAILIVLAVVLAITMPFSAAIEYTLGLSYYVDENGERVDPYAASAEGDTDGAALKVHFIDVKQGDCILIELPDGKNMLIDAGSGTNESKTVTNSIIDYISNALGDGFEYFDYAILTHPDSDHCNAFDNVLNAYPSYVCYRPNVEAKASGFTDPGKSDLSSGADSKSTAAYKNAIAAMYQTIDGTDSVVYVTNPEAEEQTISGGTGDGAYTLTFFSPLSEKYSDNNNYSPIMLLEYRGFKFALSGDAEKENEKEFVERVASAKTDGVTDKYDIFTDDFTVDVFKAGHHGSETSSSQAYLDIMTTADGAANAYYVFSCNAEGNKYYHPRQQVLDRVAAMGATNDNIKRTDHHGTITFTVSSADGAEFSLSCTTENDYDGNNMIGADTAANGGNTGDEPGDNTGDEPGDNTGDEPEKPIEYTLVYVKLGNVELRWKLVAWVGYGVVALILLLHIAGVNIFESGKRRKR